MAESGKSIDFKNYLHIIKRRRYIFIFTFMLITTVSIIVSYQMPKKYRANAIVLIENNAMINPLTRGGGGEINYREQIIMLKELLFNRRSIERIIEKLDLDLELTKNSRKMEELVEKIQSSLEIETRGSNLFQISFLGEKPQLVKDIVNTLANQYIEDNLQIKRNATSLSMELNYEEVLNYKKKLEEAEANLIEFKERNNYLSKKSVMNSTKINNYQTSLMETRLKIKELNNKKEILGKQLTGEIPINFVPQNKPLAIKPVEAPIDPRQIRLKQLERHLYELNLIYEENYPEVIKTKNELEELNKQILNTQENETKSPMPSEPEIVKSDASDQNPIMIQIRDIMLKIDLELENLTAKEKELNTEVMKIEQAFNNLPKEEQDLIRLERNVKTYETFYNTLLNKLEEVRINKEIGVKSEPGIFKIVSPAVLPVKPVKPDKSLYMLMGILAGLAGGIWIVFTIELYLDSSFKDMEELKNDLKYPIMAMIPRIEIENEVKKLKRKDMFVYATTIIYILGIMGFLFRELSHKYGVKLWGN